jgi:mannose-6-phosphate isomerase
MYDYGRPRELHIEKSLEATKLVTRAGKVQPIVASDRTILIDADYFRVERIPVSGSIDGERLCGPAQSEACLTYLFAAAGAGRIIGPDFPQVELPARGVVCIPANAPSFKVEDIGGLDLIRITPNWPGATASR